MKEVYKYMLVFCLQLFCVPGISQDLKTDLRLIGEKMAQSAGYKITVNMKVNYTKGIRQGSSSYRMMKSGGFFYYHLDDTEMLAGPEWLIMVKKNSHSMLLRPMSKEESKRLRESTVRSGLDTIIQQYDSVRYHGVEEGLKHYTVYTGKQEIRKTELYLDSANHTFSRIIYYYNQALYKEVKNVQLAFQNQELTDQDKLLFLNEEAYIKRENKKIRPASRYTGYEVSVVEQ